MTLKPAARGRLLPGQRAALEELEAMARADPGLDIVSQELDADSATLRLGVRVDVSAMERNQHGLPLDEDVEDIVIPISVHFPDYPPEPVVDHERFEAFPHVLQGNRLCIFLDPDREWHPSNGIRAVIAQLRWWLEQAAGAKFDARRALYHPVGGVHHRTPGAPAVVIRPSFAAAAQTRYRRAAIVRISDHRIDVLGWHSGGETTSVESGFVVILDRSLPKGAGLTLHDLMVRIGSQAPERVAQVIGGLQRTASVNPPDTSLLLIVAVPSGAASDDHHLLAARIPVALANRLRAAAAADPTGVGARLDQDAALEWCLVSDERPEISTRRDVGRPVNAFANKSVEVWGTGGLGSWIAEFVTRAGAASVTLRDKGEVTRGLLVRQNFSELSVGLPKATALGVRLQAISDDVRVTAVASDVLRLRDSGLPDCDVIVDATVSNAVTAYLDEAILGEPRRPFLIQVSTDVRSGTLGLVVAVGQDWQGTLSRADAVVAEHVRSNAQLEQYRVFWDEPGPGEELVPARGCSVPTFHGAAADTAAVAGCLTTFGAAQLTARTSGAHLFALPTAGGGIPSHVYVPVRRHPGSVISWRPLT